MIGSGSIGAVRRPALALIHTGVTLRTQPGGKMFSPGSQHAQCVSGRGGHHLGHIYSTQLREFLRHQQDVARLCPFLPVFLKRLRERIGLKHDRIERDTGRYVLQFRQPEEGFGKRNLAAHVDDGRCLVVATLEIVRCASQLAHSFIPHDPQAFGRSLPHMPDDREAMITGDGYLRSQRSFLVVVRGRRRLEIEADLRHGDYSLVPGQGIEIREVRAAQRTIQILRVGAHCGKQRRIRVSESDGAGRAGGRHPGHDNRANVRFCGTLQNARQLRIVVLIKMGVNVDEQTVPHRR